MCSARYRTGWKREAKVQGITCEERRREMDGLMKVNKRFYTLVKRENNAQNELSSGSDQQRAMRRVSLTPPNGGEENTEFRAGRALSRKNRGVEKAVDESEER